jgi:phenylalanyl-tRNA synthetase alpha chain
VKEEMLAEILEIRDSGLAAATQADSNEALEQVRIQYLGRKGRFSTLTPKLPLLPPEERPRVGELINESKRAIEEAVAARSAQLERERLERLGDTEAIDVTFPGTAPALGHLHVLTLVQREIETVMETLGYHVEIGPDVETDWYNFEALNLPVGHASRDMQDTFFVNASEELLLRTHTSPMQIRAMERLKTPPIYAAIPGRTFRRDATDPSHLSQFMQVEALAIDEGITVGDLKGTILYFAQSLWGADRRIRIRPSFFPYTEPSFEFDLSCGVCGGEGCRTCGGDGWLEVGGCGMIHPNVLRNGGIDPERYSGFAWGFGIERIAMLKYDVDDIRLFYENDLRFLEQFA